MTPVYFSFDNGKNWKEMLCHESVNLNCRSHMMPVPKPEGTTWTLTVEGRVIVHRKKANNLVKRLAARAIIYASLHN